MSSFQEKNPSIIFNLVWGSVLTSNSFSFLLFVVAESWSSQPSSTLIISKSTNNRFWVLSLFYFTLEVVDTTTELRHPKFYYAKPFFFFSFWSLIISPVFFSPYVCSLNLRVFFQKGVIFRGGDSVIFLWSLRTLYANKFIINSLLEKISIPLLEKIY
jgi:hypothetical protein